MATVYKYCDAQGVKILQDLELKITPPNQFNDPFEFTPRVICSSPNKNLKQLFRDKNQVRDLFHEHKRLGIFKGTAREFRKRFREKLPTLVPAFTEKMPEARKELQASYLSAMSERHGVLCLSARRNSIVMWGHYGNKHQGVAIGFDSTWPLFCGTRGMRAVSYVRERPVWNMSWVPGGVEEKAFIEQLVFSKNKEWEYEDELRQLFTLDGLKRRPLSNGAQGFFLPIPPDIISTVSLGKQCPSSLEDEVRRALKGPRLSHVKLDRAMLHESDFDLRFVQ